MLTQYQSREFDMDLPSAAQVVSLASRPKIFHHRRITP
jgi:hypothetical protein